MSHASSQAKLHTVSKKLVYGCEFVRKEYTNFAGTNVPPLTEEQYKKGMRLAIEKMKTW